MKKIISMILILALLVSFAGCRAVPEELEVDTAAGGIDFIRETEETVDTVKETKIEEPSVESPKTEDSTETGTETPPVEESDPEMAENIEEPSEPEEDLYPKMKLATEGVVFEEAFPELQKPEEFKGFTSVTRKKNEIIVTFDPAEMQFVGNRWDPYLHSDEQEGGINLEDYHRFLEEGGLIVAGRLEGERESHYKEINEFPGDEIYTLADLRVEHVFAGDAEEGDVLKLKEEYYPLYIEGGFPYCYSHNFTKGPVKPLDNGRLRLFLLTKSDGKNGSYELAFTYSLPQDYLSYDEEYLNSLLAFYRGERSVRKYSCSTSTSYNEDGTTTISAALLGESDFTNEEIYEEMISYNAFFNMVEEYKIKIWPVDHVNYMK